MRWNMLDYRMQTFLALCREMNYRRAAQALNMTQPGVTQHIQHLEKHYGVKLFVYDGRRLHRTPEADALKRHAESVLAREKALTDVFAAPRRVHLDVGATKTIGEFVLTGALSRYLADPMHSIRFEINNTEVLLDMLDESLLDFAVVEGVFDKKRFGWHLFKRERFTGICAASHPFAGRTVPISEVFGQTLIVREPGSGTRRLLEKSLDARGYSLDAFSRCICISQFSVITGVVADAGAISFGYAPVAAQRTDLAAFEVEHMPMWGEFNFVYCDEETARKKIELFFGKP